MLSFNEIYKMTVERKRLPEFAAPEEKMAYYELLGIGEAYGKRLITKNEATAQKAAALSRFNELRKGRLLNLGAYTSYQNNIRSAEALLSELIKRAKRGEDAETLLADAFEIISLFEGQQMNSYAHILKNRAEALKSEVA
ncbi:MAG: hypothetical protein IJD49_04350 [Clostridia bacterium]|nr:hypothetical protein [Clostridia bacterium]